jgi:hypothetical protein
MYSAEEARAIKLEELENDLKRLYKTLKDRKEDIANNNFAVAGDLLKAWPGLK